MLAASANWGRWLEALKVSPIREYVSDTPDLGGLMG